MISRVLNRVGKALCVTALAGLSAVAIAACSAGGEGSDGGGVDDLDYESVGSTSEAISANCWDPASTSITRGFATPYVSAATYSDCFRAKIVEIRDYAMEYRIGGYTSVGWAEAAPTEAECLSSYVMAYLFEKSGNSWNLVTIKTAHGDLRNDSEPGDIVAPPKQPLPDGTFPANDLPPSVFGPIKSPLAMCRPPIVHFYDDEMDAGKTYRISATARIGQRETHKLRFSSTKGTCGQDEGMACCTTGLDCNHGSGLFCNASDKCEHCGDKGDACCTFDEPSKPYCLGADESCQGGSCLACGSDGQACCTKDKFNARSPCDSGLTCNANKVCKAPAPVKDCGGLGEDCCDSGPKCDGTLNCFAGTCKDAQPAQCGFAGLACCAGAQPCIGAGTTCDGTKCIDPIANCSAPGDVCCYGQSGPNYCANTYNKYLKCNLANNKCF